LNPYTHDNLTDPNRREVTTVFTTPLRVAEGTFDAGTIRVAVTTRHNKSAKRIETNVHREVRTDTGFITRSVVLFAGPSLDGGIILSKEPAPRFNANKARDMHGFVVDNLELMLTHDGSAVAHELLDLLALTSVVA